MTDDDYTKLAQRARTNCACYECCGLRNIGAHTLSGKEARTTPQSCVANTLLHHMLQEYADG